MKARGQFNISLIVRISAGIIVYAQLTAFNGWCEEGHTVASGIVKPAFSIATGKVVALRTFGERINIKLKTGPNKIVRLTIPKWTVIKENTQEVKFFDFYHQLRVGDTLSVIYATNIERDLQSRSIEIIERKGVQVNKTDKNIKEIVK